MARPSITGTTVGTAATANATTDITMTIPAGAKALCVGFGGWGGGLGVTVTSVQIDPTGTPYDVDDVTLYNQRGTDQYGGLYVMYDTNTNWPGTGSVTVRVTISAASRELKACLFCLTDVDTAGTPLNGSDITGESAASTPSMSVTSTANALNIGSVGSYSADIHGGDNTQIYAEQNGGSSSSFYIWHEDGTTTTDTVEGNASVAWGGVAASFEGTSASTFGLDSAPSTVAKGQTGVSFVVSNPATVPTTGNTTVINSGDALTVTSVTGSDPYTINCTVPLDITKQVGSYVWTITVDAETVNTASIPLTAQSGWTNVVLSSPVSTVGYMLNGYTGDAAVTGDTLEYETTTDLTIGTDSEWIWATAPTVTQVVGRRVIQVDGTVGATEDATFSVIAPPVLSSPTGVTVSSSVASGTVSTNTDNGTLYFYASTNVSENIATIKASGGNQAVSATGSQAVSFTGLTASTVYYAHYIHTDTSNGDSNVVSSASFTTLAAPVLSLPTALALTSATASGTITTDTANGTLFYYISTTASETLATIKASGSTQAVSGIGTQNVSFAGLTANTTYYMHYVHTNTASSDSNVQSSTSFTTEAAPVLSLPTGTTVNHSTASGTVTTDIDNGTLYYYVSLNATETLGTIQASGSTQVVSASGVRNVTLTGLTAETTYYVHYVHTDAAGNDSNAVSSTSFTTDVSPAPTSNDVVAYNMRQMARRVIFHSLLIVDEKGKQEQLLMNAAQVLLGRATLTAPVDGITPDTGYSGTQTIIEFNKRVQKALLTSSNLEVADVIRAHLIVVGWTI
jgi:predicted enzyme related to lactoylglutathione lyase